MLQRLPLREQLFQSLWFLISVADALYLFIKVLTTSKTFTVLTCIYTKPKNYSKLVTIKLSM